MTDDLRALAEAATTEPPRMMDGGRLNDAYLAWDASRTALARAASPDRILALLDELDRLRAALQETALAFHAIGNHDALPGLECPIERCVANRAALGVSVERDQQERFKWAANERTEYVLAAARYMLELVAEYYGTDHEFDVPDEAEFRRHRAVIER